MSYTEFDAFADFVGDEFPKVDRGRVDLTRLYDKLSDTHPVLSEAWLRQLMYGAEMPAQEAKRRLREFVVRHGQDFLKHEVLS